VGMNHDRQFRTTRPAAPAAGTIVCRGTVTEEVIAMSIPRPAEPTGGQPADADRVSREARDEADEVALARLAAVVESSEDAIVSADPAGRITSWNGTAERLYGYTANELLGRPCPLFAPPDRHEELESAKKRLARGESVPPLETVRVCRD